MARQLPPFILDDSGLVAPCLEALDDREGKKFPQEVLVNGEFQKVNSPEELAGAYCDKKMQLRDILKKKVLGLFLDNYPIDKVVTKEICEALKQASTQFDFLNIFIKIVRQEDTPLPLKGLKEGIKTHLGYALEQHPFNDRDVCRICTSCRRAISDLLKELIEKPIQADLDRFKQERGKCGGEKLPFN